MKKLYEVKERTELKEILKKNPKLYEEVKEDYIEDVMSSISNIFSYIKDSLYDWSIDFGKNNIIMVDYDKINEFCDELIEANEDYGFLLDENIEKVEELQRANFLTDIYSNNYEKELKKVYNLLEEVTKLVENEFNNYCELNDEILLDHFFNYYFTDKLDWEIIYINDKGILCETK